MALDRLMRCGRDEMKFAQRIRVNGKWKFYDPVEYNDFWWYTTPPKDWSQYNDVKAPGKADTP